MKTIIYYILIFSFISCGQEKERNIPKHKKVTQKINRDIDFITDSITNTIKSNPNKELDSFVRSKTTFKRFQVSTGINNWTYNTEFYENGNLKKKGLYLNGWSFGKWYEYDKTGEIISEIDYSNAKVIKGKKLNFESIFLKHRTESDSLLIARFGKSFFENHIRLNIDRSYWYNSSNSGNFLEQRKSIPEELLLRYSIVENDTIIFTPIEIRFKKESDFEIKEEKGIPKSYYDFKINYQKAKVIAEKNGFGIERHNNEFSQQEYLSLFYNPKEQSYYWSISNVFETLYSETDNGKIRKGIGKSIIINCKNGKVIIDDFGGSIIYD